MNGVLTVAMQLIAPLQEHPAAFFTLAIVLGLIVGSFLNVVIHRLPRMMMRSWRQECRQLMEMGPDEESAQASFNLLTPGSRCPACEHRITALENIPVVSYLMLGGKCSQCKSRISIRYPLIETISAAAAFMAAFHFGVSLQAAAAMLLGWALIALTVIDLEHQLLPDDITMPFLWLGIILNMFGVFTDLYSSIIGAVAGYLILWSVYMLFKLVTGKEGMGFGDFKLLAMLGAWMGWQVLPLIIILSSFVGAVVGITLILFCRHGRSEPIPFGPYLAAAGWIALLYGNTIIQEYYHWSLDPL